MKPLGFLAEFFTADVFASDWKGMDGMCVFGCQNEIFSFGKKGLVNLPLFSRAPIRNKGLIRLKLRETNG